MAELRWEGVRVEGWAGSGTIVFSGYAKHGEKSRVHVQVHVTPEEILNLARLLLMVGRRDGQWCPGHAVYHRGANNRPRSDLPLPCSSCDPDPDVRAISEALGRLLDGEPSQELPQ